MPAGRQVLKKNSSYRLIYRPRKRRDEMPGLFFLSEGVGWSTGFAKKKTDVSTLGKVKGFGQFTVLAIVGPDILFKEAPPPSPLSTIGV